jgi:hypothetical protein
VPELPEEDSLLSKASVLREECIGFGVISISRFARLPLSQGDTLQAENNNGKTINEVSLNK